MFRVVGIHFWLRMVKIPEIRLTNPNIYRITYIWNNSGGNAELVPLPVPVGGTTVWFWCRCTWFGADGKYRLN